MNYSPSFAFFISSVGFELPLSTQDFHKVFSLLHSLFPFQTQQVYIQLQLPSCFYLQSSTYFPSTFNNVTHCPFHVISQPFLHLSIFVTFYLTFFLLFSFLLTSSSFLLSPFSLFLSFVPSSLLGSIVSYTVYKTYQLLSPYPGRFVHCVHPHTLSNSSCNYSKSCNGFTFHPNVCVVSIFLFVDGCFSFWLYDV